MNLESIKVLADSITKLGTLGQETAILFILEKLLSDLFFIGFLSTVVILGYRLIVKYNAPVEKQIIEKIASEYDGSTVLSRGDVLSICRIIKEYKANR